MTFLKLMGSFALALLTECGGGSTPAADPTPGTVHGSTVHFLSHDNQHTLCGAFVGGWYTVDTQWRQRDQAVALVDCYACASRHNGMAWSMALPALVTPYYR